MDEAIAFFDRMAQVPDDHPTACAGWLAHDLLEHVAAGAAEMARVIALRLAGDPAPPTRGFGPREAPFRALPGARLRDRLAVEGAGLLEQFRALELQAPEMHVPFTGWDMSITQLRMHARSELALHRWDLTGDDEMGLGILSRPELTQHAVDSLNAFVSLRESPAARARVAGLLSESLQVRLRAEGFDDIVVTIGAGSASFAIAAPADGPSVELDPAARLLVLWGRGPTDVLRANTTIPSERLGMLQRWLFALPRGAAPCQAPSRPTGPRVPSAGRATGPSSE